MAAAYADDLNALPMNVYLRNVFGPRRGSFMVQIASQGVPVTMHQYVKQHKNPMRTADTQDGLIYMNMLPIHVDSSVSSHITFSVPMYLCYGMAHYKNATFCVYLFFCFLSLRMVVTRCLAFHLNSSRIGY